VAPFFRVWRIVFHKAKGRIEMSQEQSRNKSLFLAAIEIESAAERDDFLKQECGENQELRNDSTNGRRAPR
jgi:hypothetical protein